MLFWGKIWGGLLGYWLIDNNWITHLLGMTLGIFLGHLFDRVANQQINKNKNTLIIQEKEEFVFENIFSVMGSILSKTQIQLTKSDIEVAYVYLDLAYHQKENFIASEFHLLNALQTTPQRLKMQRSFVQDKDNALLNSLQATKHRTLANKAFSNGKTNKFSLHQTMNNFTQFIGDNRNILQVFLGIQIHLSYTYCDPRKEEKIVLQNIGKYLGFSKVEVNRLIRIIGEQQQFYRANQQINKPNYYQILGVEKIATVKDIKRAYRKQMSLYHPDKLASKNLPEELIQQAKEQAQRIQEAYDTLRQS